MLVGTVTKLSQMNQLMRRKQRKAREAVRFSSHKIAGPPAAHALGVSCLKRRKTGFPNSLQGTAEAKPMRVEENELRDLILTVGAALLGPDAVNQANA